MHATAEKTLVPEEIEEERYEVSPMAASPKFNSVHEAERVKLARKIRWKLDRRVIPLLTCLYLSCWIDRANVGNAKILGMADDLGISSSQYGTALAVFYIFYILVELPSTILLRIISPRRWLSGLGIACGIISMCLAFVQNYTGFVVVRILLGVFEGGILPGCIVYLSGMYTRRELAARVGVFYTAASLAGAFSGLLARGLSSIGPGHGLAAGWRWIMLVEGLLTVSVSMIAYLLLPNNISAATFLTLEERELAINQLVKDNPVGISVEGEKFRWSEVRRGVLNLQVWLAGSAYITILSGMYSFSVFLPSIIKDLGYTANSAQLYSVIPYAVATAITVVVCIASDKLKIRGPFMMCTFTLGIIGYAVIANVDNSKVKFGMTSLMATGLYCSAAPCIAWVSNNSAGHYKRAASSGLLFSVANLGGFIGSFIYPAEQGPRYFKSHTIVMSLLCWGWLAVLLNILYCAKINRDKVRGKYDEFIGCGDDRDPAFKMIL